MAEITGTARPEQGAPRVNPVSYFLRSTEIDTRLLGMIGALALIWIGFHLGSAWLATGNPFNWAAGVFITPRNLWNLSVQTASVAVMATGMVLVIVTRNIDLSVGSILGFVGMLMGVTQTALMPSLFGLGHPATWVAALAVGIGAGALIGGFQGWIIAFLGVPSFIVTLGGLLVWRGAAWWVTSGQTVAPMDGTFKLMGGGPYGAIGDVASWAVAIVACALIIGLIISSRQQRKRFRFPRRPLWAEITVAVIGCGVVIAAVWVANSFLWPPGIINQYAAANGLDPAGLTIAHGIAIPVLIALGVAVVMTFIASRTRFGRYVFAIGGNPEAAELAGINTRWVTMKVFMLMGALVGIASAIATARLDAATNATGTLDELYTIAAAVIGGTSLAGGLGTVAGAVLGALVMQSLQSGMVLMRVDTALQNIVVGIVLVFAVWLDGVYRRRIK